MTTRYWRDAASLILLSSSSKISKFQYNYEVLTGIRSPKSPFMPKAIVYPGGTISSKDDLNPLWKDTLSTFWKEDPSSVIIDPSTADRPFLISNVESSNQLHPDIGFRLTALRETFEETGVLLFKSLHSQPLDVSSLTDWRIKIKENPELFMKMCHEMEIAPDIWSLYEWSCWLTPLGLKYKGNRRFDTIFYMAFTNKESHPHVEADENEIFSVEWNSPDSILMDREEKEYYIGPPQLWETARFLNFKTLTSLQEFCIKRSKMGCRSLFPVMARLPKGQGYFSFLPGDDYYPEEANPRQSDEEYEIYDVDEEYKEVMRYTRFRNRIYISSDKQFSLPFSNVKDPHGQVKPMEYIDLMIN